MTSAPFILGICSHPWLRNAGASHADLAFFKLRQCESDFNHIGWGGQYRGRLRGSSTPSATLVRLTAQDRPETPRVVLRYFCLGRFGCLPCARRFLQSLQYDVALLPILP